MATIAVYLPALGGGFVWDDAEYIVTNTHLRRGFLDVVSWSCITFYASNWHPLTWLSHFVDIRFFGLAPRGHHLVNIILHATNGVLLLQFLRRTTGALWPSVLVAAFFALHPLRVESVAWVAERKDLLSFCLFVLTLLAYVAFARTHSGGLYALALLLYALGLMAKPMLVTVPPLLLLLDWWPLGRWAMQTTPHRRALILEKVPFLALAAVSSVLTIFAQVTGGALKDLQFLPLAARLANIPVAYVGYLWHTVWPTGLSPYYPLPVGGTAPGEALAALVPLLGTTVLAAAFARRRPWLLAGWLWFLGTLIPVIGLVQVGLQASADRYTYLPLVGVFVALIWTGSEFARRRPDLRGALAGVAGATLVALGVTTFVQTRFWVDDETLNRRAIAMNAESWLAHTNLGLTLHRQGRDEEASAHLREALRINPGSREATFKTLVGLASTLAALGRHEEALARYREALGIRPDHEVARVNLANILDNLGRTDEAIVQYREALRFNSDSELAHFNLGLALRKRGLLAEARRHFQETLRIRPDHRAAQFHLEQMSHLFPL